MTETTKTTHNTETHPQEMQRRYGRRRCNRTRGLAMQFDGGSRRVACRRVLCHRGSCPRCGVLGRRGGFVDDVPVAAVHGGGDVAQPSSIHKRLRGVGSVINFGGRKRLRTVGSVDIFALRMRDLSRPRRRHRQRRCNGIGCCASADWCRRGRPRVVDGEVPCVGPWSGVACNLRSTTRGHRVRLATVREGWGRRGGDVSRPHHRGPITTTTTTKKVPQWKRRVHAHGNHQVARRGGPPACRDALLRVLLACFGVLLVQQRHPRVVFRDKPLMLSPQLRHLAVRSLQSRLLASPR